MKNTLYTIGFTKKSAEEFFLILEKNNVNYVIDVRLRPYGQLAGFTKQNDLKYFLNKIIKCNYIHISCLSPTTDILNNYRKTKNWDLYVKEFKNLLDRRNIPDILDKELFVNNSCCLLCSESLADKCHRRLVAERISETWGGFLIKHL